MGRKRQTGRAAVKYDPMESVQMPNRSRYPAPQQSRSNAINGARRRSQSRAAIDASTGRPYASVLQHLNDIPTLPVRQQQTGTVRRHDEPVVHDPYSSTDQPDDRNGELDEEGEEEVAVEASEDEDSQEDGEQSDLAPPPPPTLLPTQLRPSLANEEESTHRHAW